jgi:EpsI family protein
MEAGMNPLRYWLVVLLLASTVSVLFARGNTDVIPPRQPLADLPHTIAGWTGTDEPIDQETLSVLGSGDFLSRNYTRGAQLLPIDLFIGYFPTQRTGETIHSPKHCLPGAGWTFDSGHYVHLKDVRGEVFQVGEYIISNGEAKDFVIYWYQSQGRSVASDLMAKIYMVIGAIRYDRTDGALVRVITPIGPNETAAQARTRAESFTAQLGPMLNRYIPK